MGKATFFFHLHVSVYLFPPLFSNISNFLSLFLSPLHQCLISIMPSMCKEPFVFISKRHPVALFMWGLVKYRVCTPTVVPRWGCYLLISVKCAVRRLEYTHEHACLNDHTHIHTCTHTHLDRENHWASVYDREERKRVHKIKSFMRHEDLIMLQFFDF